MTGIDERAAIHASAQAAGVDDQAAASLWLALASDLLAQGWPLRRDVAAPAVPLIDERSARVLHDAVVASVTAGRRAVDAAVLGRLARDRRWRLCGLVRAAHAPTGGQLLPSAREPER